MPSVFIGGGNTRVGEVYMDEARKQRMEELQRQQQEFQMQQSIQEQQMKRQQMQQQANSDAGADTRYYAGLNQQRGAAKEQARQWELTRGDKLAYQDWQQGNTRQSRMDALDQQQYQRKREGGLDELGRKREARITEDMDLNRDRLKEEAKARIEYQKEFLAQKQQADADRAFQRDESAARALDTHEANQLQALYAPKIRALGSEATRANLDGDAGAEEAFRQQIAALESEMQQKLGEINLRPHLRAKQHYNRLDAAQSVNQYDEAGGNPAPEPTPMSAATPGPVVPHQDAAPNQYDDVNAPSDMPVAPPRAAAMDRMAQAPAGGADPDPVREARRRMAEKRAADEADKKEIEQQKRVSTKIALLQAKHPTYDGFMAAAKADKTLDPETKDALIQAHPNNVELRAIMSGAQTADDPKTYLEEQMAVLEMKPTPQRIADYKSAFGALYQRNTNGQMMPDAYAVEMLKKEDQNYIRKNIVARGIDIVTLRDQVRKALKGKVGPAADEAPTSTPTPTPEGRAGAMERAAAQDEDPRSLEYLNDANARTVANLQKRMDALKERRGIDSVPHQARLLDPLFYPGGSAPMLDQRARRIPTSPARLKRSLGLVERLQLARLRWVIGPASKG